MGRPTPKPGEPLWTDDDQDKVAAFLAMQRQVCPRCGTTEADWVDPTTGRFRADPPWEPFAFQCWGCEQLEAEEGKVPKGERGVRVVMVAARHHDNEDDDGG